MNSLLQGNLPITVAAANGNLNAVKVLADHGADIDGSCEVRVIRSVISQIKQNKRKQLFLIKWERESLKGMK